MSAISVWVSEQQHFQLPPHLARPQLKVSLLWKSWEWSEASPLSLPGTDLPSCLPPALSSVSVWAAGTTVSEQPQSWSKILVRDYHLALNIKCGQTVNKSHKAAVLRLTTANLLRLLSAASRSSVEKSEPDQQSGVISQRVFREIKVTS